MKYAEVVELIVPAVIVLFSNKYYINTSVL